MSKPDGLIIYDGPSTIDHERIVVIATGFKRSKNKKTGSVIQTWILVANQGPFDAAESGDDYSICGDCKHRHFRSCYVNLAHGPAHVWDAWKRGKYTPATPKSLDLFQNKFVRFGSYGDPVAVPVSIWNSLLSVMSSHTSYTHRWRVAPDAYRQFCMASCDTEKEVKAARAKGWRPFYARLDTDLVPEGFFICPASAEGGRKLTCVECNGCRGKKSSGQKDATIIIHGPTWKILYYKRGIKRFKNNQQYVGVN